MAITLNQPNTIHLSGSATEIGDLEAGVAICPGMIIERYNPSGTIIRCRPHATASVATSTIFAVEQSELNQGVNDGYAIKDLVRAKHINPDGTAWALIASGQNITAGQKMESAGDGTLKAYATLGAAICYALESVNNTNGNAGPTNPPPQTGSTTALPVGAARIRVGIV